VTRVTQVSFFCYRKLNLYGTAVSIKPLTNMLKTCYTLEHLNLTACRGLPRGIKRLYSNRDAIVQLKNDIINGKFTNSENDDDD
jgi:F-box/leucine-rich repeat protein 6